MPNPRVLVVDDDKLMRTLLKSVLRDEGFDVVGEARDGHAAIDDHARLTPDIVCLDVNMPGLSGLDTLKALRQRNPQPCVVMITGDASLATVREAVSNGAAGYIIKPFSASRVGNALRAALKSVEEGQIS